MGISGLFLNAKLSKAKPKKFSSSEIASLLGIFLCTILIAVMCFKKSGNNSPYSSNIYQSFNSEIQIDNSGRISFFEDFEIVAGSEIHSPAVARSLAQGLTLENNRQIEMKYSQINSYAKDQKSNMLKYEPEVMAFDNTYKYIFKLDPKNEESGGNPRRYWAFVFNYETDSLADEMTRSGVFEWTVMSQRRIEANNIKTKVVLPKYIKKEQFQVEAFIVKDVASWIGNNKQEQAKVNVSLSVLTPDQDRNSSGTGSTRYAADLNLEKLKPGESLKVRVYMTPNFLEPQS